jgi:hypothetical protein
LAGQFALGNYKQALSIIASNTPEIEHFKTTFGYQDRDFVTWREEEIAYLRNLAKEPEYDVFATSYVEALEALKNAE